MKLNHWAIVSMAGLLIVGCTAGTVEPSAEASSAPSPETSVSVVPSAAPDVAQASQTIERSGSFVSGEHPTQGTARLVMRNGQAFIELGEDFETSELGPDLVVILHRSDDVIGSTRPPAFPINEGDYVVLAPLRQFSGAQTYAIPASVNLDDYQSAGIWCRKFNAMFGAAALVPVNPG
jgi:hypothetical protein